MYPSSESERKKEKKNGCDVCVCVFVQDVQTIIAILSVIMLLLGRP